MDEFRREGYPCARIEHQCDLCKETIEKGKKYVHIVQSYSGDIFDSCYHDYCYDLVERYCQTLDNGDLYDEYNVLDDINERVCSSCGFLEECQFGYRHSPKCPKVNSDYRRERNNAKEEF